MTTPNSDQPNSKSSIPSFNSAPSSRAISLVAAAIIFGIILVIVVDADNSSNKTSQANTTTTTTATTAPTTSDENNSSDESTTTTTVAVSGTKDPSEVSVLVLNGSSIAGVAATTSSSIEDEGYKVLTAANDESKDKGTFVYYKSGFQKDAEQLSKNILPALTKRLNVSSTIETLRFPGSAPTTWDQENLVAANIVIVLGDPTS